MSARCLSMPSSVTPFFRSGHEPWRRLLGRREPGSLRLSSSGDAEANSSTDPGPADAPLLSVSRLIFAGFLELAMGSMTASTHGCHYEQRLRYPLISESYPPHDQSGGNVWIGDPLVMAWSYESEKCHQRERCATLRDPSTVSESACSALVQLTSLDPCGDPLKSFHLHPHPRRHTGAPFGGFWLGMAEHGAVQRTLVEGRDRLQSVLAVEKSKQTAEDVGGRREGDESI
ncbi:hypothetical protein B0T21DRAFT_124029 [Apiosordaria backusii]|uniref:Uncharacterized protein n=1 Tax=Apiosordaria backusii TaxID=314023 RepID=A0AA40EMK2_9PEZI|nr:hypothetical protein B0T21DRAFT_124029 [Apiosordaria backusii]